MNCITFGQLQKCAARAGLVLSRDPKSLLVNLRYRDERQSTTRWRGLTFHEAWMLVEGLTERAPPKTAGHRPDASPFI
ncbi:hypothetical protein [Brevundimonas lenta]|uniref:Uncharacterized protein n=1 Tax=Brevundimonas lenta TaxID=424796 RepID=A0A7W6JFN2_9CAUL|nr:hypothetical protein [Brevundimonas lenta]MBB4084284.1 hypothetical protein [Brevundimonas lenta]